VIPLKDRIRLGRVPLITIALIAGNFIAFLFAIRNGGSIITGPTHETLVRYGAIPYEFSHLGQHCDLGLSGFGQAVLCTGRGVAGTAPRQPATWETALSAMFIQVNALALIVNMAFLAVFGPTVEDTVGRARFFAFYILGGLAALALQVAVAPGSHEPTLGSAGAIAAVLGAYILLYPRERILSAVLLVFSFTLVEVPAWVLLIAWVLFDAAMGALGVTTPFGGGASVTYYAQIGGFAFGLLAAAAFTRSRPAGVAAGVPTPPG
jgi:membrane associated rhomboid family serine protease